MNSQWVLQNADVNENGHLFDLNGKRMVKVFLGRKLDYESKHCEKQRKEADFVTAVEFSAEHPYGKAVALLNLKSRCLKAKEEWFVLPGLVSVFILSHILKKEGRVGLTIDGKSTKKIDGATQKVNVENDQRANFTASIETEVHSDDDMTLENAVIPKKDGSYNGNYGGEKGNTVKSGGCGAGCGNTVKSGGCGGCGAGCGNMVKSGSCSGCGAGCGNMVKSGSCGGCGAGCGSGCGGSGGCGGGCGSMANSSGCGGYGAGCGSGGCGGGCGSMVNNSSACGGCGAGCGGCGGGCGSMVNSSECKAAVVGAAEAVEAR